MVNIPRGQTILDINEILNKGRCDDFHILDFIHYLTDRERFVLKERMDGKTFKEIAQSLVNCGNGKKSGKLGVSIRRAFMLQQSALRKICRWRQRRDHYLVFENEYLAETLNKNPDWVEPNSNWDGISG